MERDEARRLKVYRQMFAITGWEEALRTLYEWSKGNAVSHVSAGNSEGAHYWSGRADGVEDLMAKIRNSKKVKRSKKPKADSDEEVEIA